MNKRQYQRLLQLRASEEKMFFEICKASSENGIKPREVIKALPIHHKRAWYLLEKWSDKGLYDYGVNLELGWFPRKEKI